MITGCFGGITGVAQVIAPTLGGMRIASHMPTLIDFSLTKTGVFMDKLTWRWCFWINLSLVGVTFFIIIFLLHLPPSPELQQPGRTKAILDHFDVIGTCLLIPWIICLLLALQWGGVQYPWSSWRLIMLLAMFSVLFLGWLLSQWYQGDNATVSFRILYQHTQAFRSCFSFCLCASFFIIMIYYITIWFQSVGGVSAYNSGINLLDSSASMSVFVIVGGWW